MKTSNIKIAALGLLALGLASCGDDYLDTSSKTALNSESFYSNEAQANAAVVGCYDGYQATVSEGCWPNLFLASEFASDDCYGGGGPDDRSCRVLDRMDLNYNASDVSAFEATWEWYYKAINRCFPCFFGTVIGFDLWCFRRGCLRNLNIKERIAGCLRFI